MKILLISLLVIIFISLGCSSTKKVEENFDCQYSPEYELTLDNFYWSQYENGLSNEYVRYEYKFLNNGLVLVIDYGYWFKTVGHDYPKKIRGKWLFDISSFKLVISLPGEPQYDLILGCISKDRSFVFVQNIEIQQLKRQYDIDDRFKW